MWSFSPSKKLNIIQWEELCLFLHYCIPSTKQCFPSSRLAGLGHEWVNASNHIRPFHRPSSSPIFRGTTTSFSSMHVHTYGYKIFLMDSFYFSLWPWRLADLTFMLPDFIYFFIIESGQEKMLASPDMIFPFFEEGTAL